MLTYRAASAEPTQWPSSLKASQSEHKQTLINKHDFININQPVDELDGLTSSLGATQPLNDNIMLCSECQSKQLQ